MSPSVFGAVLLAALFATAAVAEIREGPCYCYAGASKDSEAPCSCSCPAPWLPPRCNFKAASNVELKVLVSSNDFSSENFVASINANVAGVTTASFRRKTGTAVTFDSTAAFDVRIVVTGSDVAAFLSAVESQTAAVRALGIVAADLSEKRAADVFEPDRLVIYTHADPSFTVTASNAGWFLSALVLIFLLPVVELCCCLSYSSADIEVLEQEEADARAVEKYRQDAEAQAAAFAATTEGLAHDDNGHHPTEGVVVADDPAGVAHSPKEQPPGVPPAVPPPAAAGDDVVAVQEPSQSSVFRPEEGGTAEMRPTGAAEPPGHVGDHDGDDRAMAVESCAY